ncbi:hypothetical protein [Brevibacterium salitolerans]|uniref:Acetone carboxylase n=1 Tax=Brevibacterium salitolerans TaxID=1403566 RepID=A0ABP5I0Y3_9MICO
MIGTPDRTPELICSAKACRDTASHALLWNNPRIHTPERRKVWLACPAHRESLAEFLSLRGFLHDIVPTDAIPEGVG